MSDLDDSMRIQKQRIRVHAKTAVRNVIRTTSIVYARCSNTEPDGYSAWKNSGQLQDSACTEREATYQLAIDVSNTVIMSLFWFWRIKRFLLLDPGKSRLERKPRQGSATSVLTSYDRLMGNRLLPSEAMSPMLCFRICNMIEKRLTVTSAVYGMKR
ncbi:hypothetical protein IF2G_08378 [Cordyceps javanica]|nr:hypothetical protein IF2G_08378 [Cordyceps javanica]